MKSPELCLFGFSFQGEASARAGVGAKAAVGAGITVDKAKLKLRPYILAGGYAGAGVETELKINVGLDEEYHQRVAQEFKKVANVPRNKQVSDELDDLITKAKNDSPTTYWGCFWKEWSISCWQEAKQNHREQMSIEAIFNAGTGCKIR